MLSDQEMIQLTDDQLSQLSKDELALKYKQLFKYAENLKLKSDQNQKENEKKLSQLDFQKSLEIAKLKNVILVKYMNSKESEAHVNFLKMI